MKKIPTLFERVFENTSLVQAGVETPEDVKYLNVEERTSGVIKANFAAKILS